MMLVLVRQVLKMIRLQNRPPPTSGQPHKVLQSGSIDDLGKILAKSISDHLNSTNIIISCFFMGDIFLFLDFYPRARNSLSPYLLERGFIIRWTLQVFKQTFTQYY